MAALSLEMKNIVKEFPGVLALDNAHLEIEEGEVHALLGINGAGKSTMIKILAGVYGKDAGDIIINGENVDIASPTDSKECGVATVYQDPQMLPSFTGYENIFLGNESDSNGLFSTIHRKKLLKKAEKILEKFPVNLDLKMPVSRLKAVEKESIAILRALSQEKMNILILDEPTSILTKKEIKILFEQIELLKKQGISIIYITHRLDEVFEIADRFTIFRNGKNVATHKTTDAGMNHSKIAELMLGDKLEKVYPHKSEKILDVMMEVKNISHENAFNDISFDVKEGEVLGIFGLVGSGIDELSKSMYGIEPIIQGSLSLNGKTLNLKSSSDGLDSGIFLVPGDRRQEGQIGTESISFNMVVSNLKKVTSLFLVNRKQERMDSDSLVKKLEVRPTDPDNLVSLLSGGNQQKVVISKGLYTDSDVYIFSEPTVGVDVGAKAGIYKVIRELSEEGKGTIVIGSDCEEVYGVCDRIIVIYNGSMVANKPVSEIKLDEVLVYGLTGGQDNG